MLPQSPCCTRVPRSILQSGMGVLSVALLLASVGDSSAPIAGSGRRVGCFSAAAGHWEADLRAHRGFLTLSLQEAIQLDGQILFSLLHKVSPVAYKHLSKQKIDPILYMTEWFMCAFSRTLPWSSVLRVWDMFFCEGRSSPPSSSSWGDRLQPLWRMDGTRGCSRSAAVAACLCLAHGSPCRAGLGQPRDWAVFLGVRGHVHPKSTLTR